MYLFFLNNSFFSRKTILRPTSFLGLYSVTILHMVVVVMATQEVVHLVGVAEVHAAVGPVPGAAALETGVDLDSVGVVEAAAVVTDLEVETKAAHKVVDFTK